MTVSDAAWARIVAEQNVRLKAQGFDPEGADAALLDFDGETDPMTQEAAQHQRALNRKLTATSSPAS
jgi:hypothetical protein